MQNTPLCGLGSMWRDFFLKKNTNIDFSIFENSTQVFEPLLFICHKMHLDYIGQKTQFAQNTECSNCPLIYLEYCLVI